MFSRFPLPRLDISSYKIFIGPRVFVHAYCDVSTVFYIVTFYGHEENGWTLDAFVA